MWCVLCGVRIVLLWESYQTDNFDQSCPEKGKRQKAIIQVSRSKAPVQGADGNWWHVYGNKTANKVEGTRVDEVLF